ncbi:hypothetical protein GUJ93_ZPchr0001g32717 [Zizania palustris]|uniref:Uncharacterized protein n=1 Tax=Zizania palustris TaxID=103762 RepID=A0A8J5RTB8_ZIZPA|nr:hypothetical protein GUJ93_ZPchr0001g32717 [Zizania palustris]
MRAQLGVVRRGRFLGVGERVVGVAHRYGRAVRWLGWRGARALLALRAVRAAYQCGRRGSFGASARVAQAWASGATAQPKWCGTVGRMHRDTGAVGAMRAHGLGTASRRERAAWRCSVF